MDLSIIIVSYNSAGYLEKCLASVVKFVKNVEYEICVVDNASEDGSLELIYGRYPQVRVFANRKNHGFAVAVNQGLMHARGRYVLWLNPDSELMDRNMAAVLKYMDQETRVGVLGLKLVNTDGTIQYSCRSYPTHRNYLFGSHSILTRLFPWNPFSRKFLQSNWDHMNIRSVDWVSGACLLHRRSLLSHLGFLDEGYFMYFEDVDFCRRVNKRGWKVRYYPDCQVLHHLGGSSCTAPKQMLIERHKSIWRYYTKYFTRSPIKDGFIAVGLVIRCLIQLLLSTRSLTRRASC